MRTSILAIGFIFAGLLATVFLVDREVPLPPVGPSVERVCVETMRRSTPDLSWVAQGREEKIRGREIETVTIGELPSHNGNLVRVAGVLHAEFEWVALYRSRAVMEEELWSAPWINFDSLWPGDRYWQTKAPSISDRCVLVEGHYAGGKGGHAGLFNGTIEDVLRLDVWSSPHRPFVTTLPAPSPPTLPCSEKPSMPEKRADIGAGQSMVAEFNRLFETGEFQLGYCLFEVQVNERGLVGGVRLLSPEYVDKRVESVVVRTSTSWRFRPATACGRVVPATTSVGFFHCPFKERRRNEPAG